MPEALNFYEIQFFDFYTHFLFVEMEVPRKLALETDLDYVPPSKRVHRATINLLKYT